ncbi:MAG: hypothetical protein PHU14_11675, partial [Methylovulum sp.]|nr:hypothetical protein [Methylovulum sp.]
HAQQKSAWYRMVSSTKLQDFPILEKTVLLENVDQFSTITEEEGQISLTGGTTGASMKVIYTLEDVQERSAIIDHFRASYGYSLGKKTAWFSGKDIVRLHDLRSGNCFRDDYINRIRYFSTFHIGQRYFDVYWKAFTDFSPEYIIGFPSSVYDLCSMALERGLEFNGHVKAFFPTAETILAHHREVIGKVLGCPLIDQYASSEGAPFILQCKEDKLHIHPLTGIFEVVNEQMQPSIEGEILVTSFSTRGTPLIRYRIGDRVKLAPSEYRCKCGSCFPVVEYIDGRTSDFLWSPEHGRVNLGNISNCTKDVPGIICFQVIQNVPDIVNVSIIAGKEFTEPEELHFKKALQSRLGKSVTINIQRVDSIAHEKSGKFRLVKNQLTSEQIQNST